MSPKPYRKSETAFPKLRERERDLGEREDFARTHTHTTLAQRWEVRVRLCVNTVHITSVF